MTPLGYTPRGCTLSQRNLVSHLLSHLKYPILVLKVLQSNIYLSIYFFSPLNLSFDVKWDNSGAKNEKPRLFLE